MTELSFTTLQIMALSKVILLLMVAVATVFLFKYKKPTAFVWLTAAGFITFYLALSWPLQRMWWGNVGDEYFVLAYLAKAMFGNFGHDFYYDWLPNFYPPLYFWITALVAKLFTDNTVVAAKIGVAGTLGLWFIGSYYWLKFFWLKIYSGKLKNEIIASGWFWWLLPLSYLLLLDFDTVIFKPYEAISALGVVILVGIVSRSFYAKKLEAKWYVFVGLTGGVLFLIFHFWWLIVVPVLLVLACLTPLWKANLRRLFLFGLVVFIIGSVYLLPLFWSYLQYGSENWQATFMMPLDFYTFAPWGQWSLKAFLYLLGIIGLIVFRKKSFVKANLFILIGCYLYQLINYLLFLFGASPIAVSKPFYFLGSAAIAVGLSYLLIHLYLVFVKKQQRQLRYSLLIILMLVLLVRFPHVYFMDDPVVLRQLEIDLVKPTASIALAEKIKTAVPDYQQRTWLSSGSMDINAYLPLSYYLAQNVHFSHHASVFSQRFAEVQKLTQALDSAEFMEIIAKGQPKSVDGLLLYSAQPDDDFYTLYFWMDNFPNGGKDQELYLPKKLISDNDWQLVGQTGQWDIFIKR